MKLFLAVPRQANEGKAQTATSAGRTRELVARLPLLDTRESLLQIHRSLQGLNRTDLRIPQRLRLLDMHRSPLRVVRGQVESQFSRGAAPLSQGDLLVAGLFRDCCVEMAFGYKIIVLEIAQTRKRRQLEEMRLSMARALFYLEQTVFACALFRQSPPEGVWQEVHTLHGYARTLGIDEEPLKDPVTRVKTPTTISLTYRRALLFGLSDPFHQSVPLMSRVQDFLRRNADKAQIRKHVRSARGYCQFVIDPQSDRPAWPWTGDDKPPKNALFLDTLELTRDARDLLERLQSAEQVDIDVDSEFKDELGRKLLGEVAYKMGLVATRGSERSEGEDGSVEIMIGIDAANYCANGESPFALSSLDDVGDNAAQGTSRGHLPSVHESQLTIVTGRLVDRSDSGLRIAVRYAAAAAGTLRVGEVITCRSEKNPWEPGVIRWMRCIDDTIHFGVLKIADTVRPVGVKRVSTEREDAFRPGLVIYPDGADESVLQVITRPGLYRHQRNLFIDDGQALLMARTRKLLEGTQAIEWFECETINL